jgi:hypothetical protein
MGFEKLRLLLPERERIRDEGCDRSDRGTLELIFYSGFLDISSTRLVFSRSIPEIDTCRWRLMCDQR